MLLYNMTVTGKIKEFDSYKVVIQKIRMQLYDLLSAFLPPNCSSPQCYVSPVGKPDLPVLAAS